jgi:hypothetical protein
MGTFLQQQQIELTGHECEHASKAQRIVMQSTSTKAGTCGNLMACDCAAHHSLHPMLYLSDSKQFSPDSCQFA